MKNIYHKIISSALIVACAVLLTCTGDQDDHPGMVWIPAGEFMMGSPDGSGGINGSVAEPGRDNTPGVETLHKVTLTKGFWMSRYLITQEQFYLIMGQAPTKPAYGERYPADGLSWYDVIVFCNRLSIKEGLSPVYSISGSTNPDDWGEIPTKDRYPNVGQPFTIETDQIYTIWNSVSPNWNANGYRLPTEAEWEYACRAGTTTAWSFGSTDVKAGLYAWYYANSNGMAHPVGMKAPNDFGLYDMHGNLVEWCWDWYSETYYLSSSSLSDPEGPPLGDSRVVRGGYWNYLTQYLRSADRGSGYQYHRGNEVGFRVVRQ